MTKSVTMTKSTQRVKNALEDVRSATSNLLDAWYDLEHDMGDGNEDAKKLWNILTDTYEKSPFAHVDDSYEAVPTMMQNWIEAIEKKEESHNG